VMPGYGVEHREFNVGTEPLELPMVMLRAQTGDLMLTSVPSGATVVINGKKIEQTTPAQLHLPPGSYKVTVAKDGREGSTTVDIRTGDVKTLRVTLGQ
jgi:archaellum component FlaF (FlaF/FlaG flagellin family)